MTEANRPSNRRQWAVKRHVPPVDAEHFYDELRGLERIAHALQMGERHLRRLMKEDSRVAAMITRRRGRGGGHFITRLALAFLTLGIQNRTVEAHERALRAANENRAASRFQKRNRPAG